MEGTAERPEGADLVAWIAHRQWWIMGAVFVSETLAATVRLTLPDTGFDRSMQWVSLVVLLTYIVGEPVAWTHFSRLCAECVADMPADGSDRAERRQWTLYGFHLTARRSRWVAATFFGLMLVPLLLVYRGVWEQGSLPAVATSSILFLAYVTVTSVLAMIHRPLVPWCPYCRWGRDDDGPHEVVPDPVPPSRTPDRVT